MGRDGVIRELRLLCSAVASASRCDHLNLDGLLVTPGLGQIVVGLHPNQGFGAQSEGLLETNCHLGGDTRASLSKLLMA